MSHDPVIQVRPASLPEIEAILGTSRSTYASEISAASGLTFDDALARTDKQTALLLPQGPRTAGMTFLVATINDQVAGHLWLSATAPSERDGAWIYDIEVVTEARRHGVGRSLMTAAQHEAARGGATTIGLNVFHGNTAARELYESLGYQVTNLYMQLPL